MISYIKKDEGASTEPEYSKDPFFPAVELIDADRWDKIYPYRLIVVDANKNYLPIGNSVPNDIRILSDSATIRADYSNKWSFVLPVTPQQFSISNSYAINTTFTARGVLEEHSGLRFKDIMMSGTFGIMPTRSAYDAPAKTPFIKSVLESTTRAVANLATAANRTFTSFNGKNQYSAPPTPVGADLEQTGYYSARALDRFLEQYALAKKNPDLDTRGWRLALDVQKNNETYLVTPVNLTIRKDESRPMEEKFSLQLKAWKRINIGKGESIEISPLELDTNTYMQVFTAIRNARLAAESSLNLIKAVRSDYMVPLNGLREAGLFVKQLTNVTLTAADLPRQFIKDLKSAISDTLVSMTGDGAFAKVLNIFVKTATLGLLDTSKKFEGRSTASAAQNSKALSKMNSADPSYNVFNEPDANFSLFDSVSLQDIELSVEQSVRVDAEVERISAYTVDDLRTIRNSIYSLALDIADQYGAGNELLNSILGRPAPKARLTPMTLEENQFLATLLEAVHQMDRMNSTQELDVTRSLNPMQFVGDYASSQGVPFNEASPSKILVPVPYKKTLEEISFRYLGDSERWTEIATLNSLRNPYIDEEGFEYKLLSNGSGRQFTISGNKNLYIGQKIELYSDNVPRFSRRITSIEKLGSSENYLITVDGLSDLQVLQLNHRAAMHAYLPGTVNSQDQIYIPSQLPSEPDDYVRLVPGIKAEAIVGLSKIDLLLTEDLDIAINGQGDILLSSGLTNLIQALKIKFFTERGSILQDPNFGLGLKPGMSNADLDIQEIYKQTADLIAQDPRYAGVESMDISLEGPTLSISLKVTLANQMGVVPISFIAQNS